MKFIFLFSILSIIKILHCKIEDFELLKYKERKDFILNSTFFDIKLYMEVKDITSKKVYIYVYIQDPTKLTFYYKFEKEGEENKFQQLDAYMVVNHVNEHTLYYVIDDKPKDNEQKLYIEVVAYDFNQGQKISVESTESITDLYLILTIILIVVMILLTALICFSFSCIYKKKRDKSITETTEDVIIEKVNPEDLSPIS